MDEPMREVEVRVIIGYQHVSLVEETNATIRHMIAEDWQLFSPPIITTVHDGDGDFFQTILLTFRRDSLRSAS